MQDNHSISEQEDFTNPFSFLSEEQFRKTKEEASFCQVPVNYFDTLSERIEAELPDLELAEQESFLLLLKKESVIAPPAYFEGLPEEIDSAIRLQQLQIGREEPFAVPADYFEWLPTLIQDRISETAPARFTLAGFKQLFSPRYWIAGMVAAALVMLLGIRLFNQPVLPATAPTAVALNDTDKKEVLDNLELYGFEESVVMDHVAAKNKTIEIPETAVDKRAEIDYLIDNNADLSTLSTE